MRFDHVAFPLYLMYINNSKCQFFFLFCNFMVYFFLSLLLLVLLLLLLLLAFILQQDLSQVHYDPVLLDLCYLQELDVILCV